MSFNKRIKGGDIVIEQLDSGDSITLAQAGGVTVTGDLTVTGTTTTVDAVDLNVVDNVIVVNSGELGAGVTLGTAGIEVDRGSATNAKIIFDESDNTWKLDPGTGSPVTITTGGSGLGNIVEDATPQLGGDLDVNGHSITSAAGGDIVIVADTTGVVKVDQELTLIEQSAPTLLAGYNKIYANTAAEGGSGVYFINSAGTNDELVSVKKAVLYGLIF